MAGKAKPIPRNDLVLTNDPIVSAFAARKAARRPVGEVYLDETQTSLVIDTHNDTLEKYRPPRKKQKRGSEPRNRSSKQPQQIDGLVDERDRSIEHGAGFIESESESDLTSGSTPSAHLAPPVQRLSTFDLSKSKILNETETEWTVRLHPNDVSVWSIPSVCHKI